MPDRLIGAGFCHQISDRSPASNFPFCFRCSGLFFGISFGCLFYLFLYKDNSQFSRFNFLFFIFSFLIFIADIINKSDFLPFHLYQESSSLRFLSAFPFGYSIAGMIIPCYRHLFIKRNSISYSGSGIKCFLFMILFIILSYAMLFSEERLLIEISRIILCLGSFFFMTILYSILLKCLVILKEHTSPNDHEISKLAVCCTIFQICILGMIHIQLFRFLSNYE